MIAPNANSRTGSAYHHFANIFDQVHSQRKIHIDIVSQLAMDTDYKRPDSIAFASRAATIERARGIELFALSIDPTATPEMLSQVYGHGHFVRVEDLASLEKYALKLYQQITLY